MKNAIISGSSVGTTLIVSGVPGKKIRVLQYRVTAHVNTDIKFMSNSTDLTGWLYLGSHGVLSTGTSSVAPSGMVFEFETAPGESLNYISSGGGSIGGHLLYVEVLV